MCGLQQRSRIRYRARQVGDLKVLRNERSSVPERATQYTVGSDHTVITAPPGFVKYDHRHLQCDRLTKRVDLNFGEVFGCSKNK